MSTQRLGSTLLLSAALLISPELPARADSAPTSVQDLTRSIQERRLKVPEFKAIAEMARERGLRVYLFGGTASGLAHYIKWDAQREKGNTKFQPDRFDYDYTSIYRSNQDLDIVITRTDGTAETVEQIQEFQKAVAERYPYAQGSKSEWEVRGLKTKNGDKEVLLDNPDFLNQHTDSNSVGLIELTDPPRGQPLIQDLRDLKSAEPIFLKDVAAGRIHFYFSPQHMTTSRAAKGLNPPIIGAIRYLTKAFQYELAIDPESMDRIRAIIKDFKPEDAQANSYVGKWIEKNGRKLIQNAVSIEYALDTLESLGLKQKLIAIHDNPTQLQSLAWWMSKVPLRSKASPSKVPFGKTAKELGITVVAHETSDFQAYESITRSHQGKPNVWISRKDTEIQGENAAYGDGFYTAAGQKGARNTGFHIRFQVAPEAREDRDFILVDGGKWLVWQNAEHLEVIPEGFNLNPVAVAAFLNDPKNRDEEALKKKLLRRLQNTKVWPAETRAAFYELLVPFLEKDKDFYYDARAKLATLMSIPYSSEFPEFVDEILKSKDWAPEFIARHVLSQDHWTRHPRSKAWLSQLVEAKPMIARDELIRFTLANSHYADRTDLHLKILESADSATRETYIKEVLNQPHASKLDVVLPNLAKGLNYRGADLLLRNKRLQFETLSPHAKQAFLNAAEVVLRPIRDDFQTSFRVLLDSPSARKFPELAALARKRLPELSEEAHAAFVGELAKRESLALSPDWRSILEDPATVLLARTHYYKGSDPYDYKEAIDNYLLRNPLRITAENRASFIDTVEALSPYYHPHLIAQIKGVTGVPELLPIFQRIVAKESDYLVGGVLGALYARSESASSEWRKWLASPETQLKLFTTIQNTRSLKDPDHAKAVVMIIKQWEESPPAWTPRHLKQLAKTTITTAASKDLRSDQGFFKVDLPLAKLVSTLPLSQEDLARILDTCLRLDPIDPFHAEFAAQISKVHSEAGYKVLIKHLAQGTGDLPQKIEALITGRHRQGDQAATAALESIVRDSAYPRAIRKKAGDLVGKRAPFICVKSWLSNVLSPMQEAE